jgi:hypothetical protein
MGVEFGHLLTRRMFVCEESSEKICSEMRKQKLYNEELQN